MLRNCNTILKNGDNVFKSQVVESYLNMNSCCVQYVRLDTDGITPSNTLSVFYQTPTAVLKCTFDTDLTYCGVNFPLSVDNCVKPYYFCGNLGSVTSFCTYQNSTNGKWSGNLNCALSQFPNLECAYLDNRETDFNNDISNTEFPRNLKVFKMYDRGIQGDLTTVKNIGSIECWRLYYTPFSGNFHDIDFGGKLCCTCIQYAGASLSVNVESLLNNNTGYTHSFVYQSPGLAYCADNVDISNLTYLDWYGSYANAKGTWGVPDFNTGMTRFAITSCCTHADITNWDISNTQMNCYHMYNQYGNIGTISGSISGWTMPSTLVTFSLNYARGVTDVPTDWSGNTPNLNSLTLSQMCLLSGDVTTWILPTGLTALQFYYTELCGNLENFDFPPNVNSLQMRTSCFTGNLADINFPTSASQYYFDGNNLSGNVADVSIHSSLSTIDFSANPNVYLDLNTPLNTCNISYLRLACISGITGSFNNLTLGNNTQQLIFCYTPIESCLNDLDRNCVRYIYMNNSSLSQDVTDWFSGNTTNLYAVCMHNNPDLSGDTTNWDFNNVCQMLFQNTALSGRLCHVCPYCMNISQTNINSCIDTDLDFSVKGYNLTLNNTCLQGCLTGTSLYYPNVYQFVIHSNPNIYGANCFSNEIFANRGNFGRPYVYISYSSIGDYVTGATESLGDLGTYAGDPSGMDLTEAQVNNLVAGTDYTGGGSNTPWTERNKIWWMKNACVSSSSTTLRYSQFNIGYSSS